MVAACDVSLTDNIMDNISSVANKSSFYVVLLFLWLASGFNLF